jgi:type II secretory pathway pseudopilin PulG
VELLGVICIILVLTTFAVPVYANIVDQARQAKSKSELKLIQDALEQYKAQSGHYPDRLDRLVEMGYLKQGMEFRSPWWSPRNQIRYFYAVNGRNDSATAYALADPGPGSRCGNAKETKTSPHPKLKAGTTGPIPCGRYPHESAWVFGVPDTPEFDPTLDLYNSTGQLLPSDAVKTLAGFCCSLITEQ